MSTNATLTPETAAAMDPNVSSGQRSGSSGINGQPMKRQMRRDKEAAAQGQLKPINEESEQSAKTPLPETKTETQTQQQLGPINKPLVRRSEPGRRSTFGYPSLPELDQGHCTDGQEPQSEPTITPHKQSETYDVDIADKYRLQAIRDTDVVHVVRVQRINHRCKVNSDVFVRVSEETGVKVLSSLA
jgi:hypothetical protein